MTTISSNWKLIVAGFLVVLVTIPIVLNPSEERHLDQCVARLQAWQAAHVDACDKCTTTTDAETLRMMATSSIEEGGILLDGGLRRDNCLLFSVLTDKGLWEAKTFGCLGFVLGPAFAGPCPCFAMPDVQIPEAGSLPAAETTFAFALLADGSFALDGKSITKAELIERLDAIVAKDSAAIEIVADANTRHAQLADCMRWLSDLGFELIQFRVADDSSSGDSSTGDSSTGDSSTGDSSTGDSSTGDSSTGDSSTGP